MKVFKSMFAFMVIAISLTSCNYDRKDEGLQNVKPNSSMYSMKSEMSSLYYDIIKNEDTNKQLLIASSLDPLQMYNLWMVKIEDYKRNNNLNREQELFLNSLKRELTPQHFVRKSKERMSFDFDEKLRVSQELFGYNEGWYFLSKVENINHRLSMLRDSNSDTNNKIADDTIEPCGCTSNSDCTRIVGVALWGASWEYGECSDSKCYRETYLWGLFESKDNKRCVY